MVLVTATSGFAAMLLAHSKTSYTYHSALGFRRDGRARNPALGEIEKWGPRRFFIIDEISMAGCRDLDRISSRLQGLKANKKPFGGMHMVFTGDFNQNPPMGHPCIAIIMNTNRKTQSQRPSFGVRNCGKTS